MGNGNGVGVRMNMTELLQMVEESKSRPGARERMMVADAVEALAEEVMRFGDFCCGQLKYGADVDMRARVCGEMDAIQEKLMGVRSGYLYQSWLMVMVAQLAEGMKFMAEKQAEAVADEAMKSSVGGEVGGD